MSQRDDADDYGGLPAAEEKAMQRDAQYLRMVNQITDSERTTIYGAQAIGLLEGELAETFGIVPNRAMLLRVRESRSTVESLAMVAEIAREVRKMIGGSAKAQRETS
jgi:hypothetical protein